MKIVLTAIAMTFLCVWPVVIFGHPGHGVTEGDSVAHITVDHFGLVALIIGGVTVVAIIIRQLLNKRVKECMSSQS